MTPVIQRKVLAYITHAGRLLVFSHPESVDAGFRFPAGRSPMTRTRSTPFSAKPRRRPVSTI
jgi:hypothetical protein